MTEIPSWPQRLLLGALGRVFVLLLGVLAAAGQNDRPAAAVTR